MPWVSTERYEAFVEGLQDVETLRDLLTYERERNDTVLTAIALAQHTVDHIPDRVVAALRELPTKVLAPVVEQPMSLGLADRQRMRELEAQREMDGQ